MLLEGNDFVNVFISSRSNEIDPFRGVNREKYRQSLCSRNDRAVARAEGIP